MISDSQTNRPFVRQVAESFIAKAFGLHVRLAFHAATLLGGDVGSDLALAKISGDGPFAFSSIDPTGNVKLGDWVLKFGHPAGWRAGRAPVVRLGRVIRKIDSEFITDCQELQNVRLIGVSPEFDLALFETNSKLSNPSWRESEPMQVGSFLAAPGHGPLPLAVGIVSVAERIPKGKLRTKVVHEQRVPAEPPEWIGIPVAEHGMVIFAVDGNAAKAGIEPADELIQLGATSSGGNNVRNRKHSDRVPLIE